MSRTAARLSGGQLAWLAAACAIGLPVLLSQGWALWTGSADPLLLSQLTAGSGGGGGGGGAGGLPSPAAWVRHPLAWHAALNGAQPWRWWSAAWVHLHALHLWMNVAGWLVVLMFGLVVRLPGRQAGAWLLAWPLSHGLLMLAPALHFYAGLSGVLHAGVAVAAWGLSCPGRPTRERRIGWAVLAGLMLKVLLEQPWSHMSVVVPVAAPEGLRDWALSVVPLAHATGALAGVACAWLVSRLPD